MDEQYGQLIEPPVVPFRFGAPGWYVLSALLLLFITGIVWLVLRHYHINRYRRAALKEIAAMMKAYTVSCSVVTLLYEINMLLKRVAMKQYERRSIAGMREEEWISFLNKSRGSALFSKEDSDLLLQLYKNNKEGDAPIPPIVFVAKVQEWIKKHQHGTITF